MQQKAVFLDRDGVLNNVVIKNGKPYPPSSLDELTIPADVQTALLALKAAGFLLIGATNQPDVARGTTAKETVDAMNAYLMKSLPLDEIRVCFHDDSDQCICRKPAPGLILEAARVYDIDLMKSFMIGDRWRDILAGQQAGCKTIWLKTSYDEKKPDAPDFVANTMTEAANWIKESYYSRENL